MMVSLGLYSRFWQINERLGTLKGKVKVDLKRSICMRLIFARFQILPEKLWDELRTDYVIVCELLEAVDHELRFLILLSNLNNLYFVCFQLLNIYE